MLQFSIKSARVVLLNEDSVLGKFGVDRNVEEVMVLIGSRTGIDTLIEDSLVVPNRHEDPVNFFRVRRSDVPDWVMGRVVGVGHTHVGGMSEVLPSCHDLSSLRQFEVGLMYHWVTGMVHVYNNTRWIDKKPWRKTQ